MSKKRPATNGKPDDPEKVRLEIEWHIPEHLVGITANNALIQRDDDEFHISFFEIPPPILLGEPKDRAEQLKTLKKVRATCRARIVLSTQHFKAFAAAIAAQVNRNPELFQAPKDNSE